MISKTWSRKSIAVCLAVAVWSVYSMAVLASPGPKAPLGELSISGQVTVNGQKALSGGTLFSDSFIATLDRSSATVNISKMGRVDLAPNSNLKLSFTPINIMGMLDSGSASISTLAGVSVNIITKDGSILVDGTQPTSFTVNVVEGKTIIATQAGFAELRSGSVVTRVGAGETATTGMPAPQGGGGGLHGGRLAVLLAAAAGAIALGFYAAFHNNDLNFNGNVTVVSPTAK